MSRALPGRSVSIEVSVSRPASMTRRFAGHGSVASSTGSDGAPTVSINRQRSGPARICRIRGMKRPFCRVDGGSAGCSGTSDHRTGVRVPDSLTRKKATRLR
jgi:hypothetical protein